MHGNSGKRETPRDLKELYIMQRNQTALLFLCPTLVSPTRYTCTVSRCSFSFSSFPAPFRFEVAVPKQPTNIPDDGGNNKICAVDAPSKSSNKRRHQPTSLTSSAGAKVKKTFVDGESLAYVDSGNSHDTPRDFDDGLNTSGESSRFELPRTKELENSLSGFLPDDSDTTEAPLYKKTSSYEKDGRTGTVEEIKGVNLSNQGQAVAIAPQGIFSSKRRESGLQLSDDELEKSRKAREIAEAAANVASSKITERNERMRKNISHAFTIIGEKTRAFELGRRARKGTEMFIESKIRKGTGKDSTQQDRLSSSAASAAKSIVSSISFQWKDKIVPFVRTQLPEEFADVSANVVASVAVGSFLSLVLLPSLFSPNAPTYDQLERRKLDANTSTLERKLEQNMKDKSHSRVSKSLFPAEEQLSSPSRNALSKSKSPGATDPATSPMASPPISTQTPSTPPNPEVSNFRGEESSRPTGTKAISSEDAFTVVTQKLGTRGSFVVTVSNDSLYAEPTAAIEVKKAYHSLSPHEQRRFAEIAWQACHTLGYERVVLLEEETSRQVAQAFPDVDLDDETENLRVDEKATREALEKLAIKTARDEAEINMLKMRLDEERARFSEKVEALQNDIDALKEENSALANDLAGVKEEIAQIPELLEFEKDTVAAEDRAETLDISVEVLKAQLAKVQKDREYAKEMRNASAIEFKTAETAKMEALTLVNAQVSEAQTQAEFKTMRLITNAQKETTDAVKDAEAKVLEKEQQMQANEEESRNKFRTTTSFSEKSKNALIAEAKSKVVNTASDLETAQKKSAVTLQETIASFEKLLSEERAYGAEQVQELEKRLQKGQIDAEKVLKVAVKEAEKERDDLIAESQVKVQELKSKLEATGKTAAKRLQETSLSFKKRLAEERAAGAKQLHLLEDHLQKDEKEIVKKLKAAVLAAGKEKDSIVADLQAEVEDLTHKVEAAQEAGELKLKEMTSSLMNQIAAEHASAEKQVAEKEKSFEMMLKEIENRAEANFDAFLKEADRKLALVYEDAKAKQNVLTKESKDIQDSLRAERDEARKELKLSEDRAERAAVQAEKERENLKEQIAKLQAILHDGANNRLSKEGQKATNAQSSLENVDTDGSAS